MMSEYTELQCTVNTLAVHFALFTKLRILSLKAMLADCSNTHEEKVQQNGAPIFVQEHH